MGSKITADHIKFAAGALIILAAALIMAPDLLNFIAGLWRLGLFIVVIILLASFMGRIGTIPKLLKKIKKKTK